MTIKLQVNGVQYTGFVSADVNLRLDALSNTFAFEATAKKGVPLPFRGGESCVVLVNDLKVLTGNIEIVEVNYSGSEHRIVISGRDKTGDLLDSTLDAISDIIPPISLKELIEIVIDKLGLPIEVIDKVNPPKFNKAEDLASPSAGQNAFSFIETYARKRQVLITSNSDGNLVISKSSGTFVSSALRNQVNGDFNNVLEGSVSYDTTGRFNTYKFASSLNPTSLIFAGNTPLEKVVSQSGTATDSDIRKGRQLILISEDPFSDKQNEDRAKWEANIRKARGRVYSVTVSGYETLTKQLWDINMVVPVVDDFAGIDARMLINSVNFSENLNSGATSSLGLVNEEAYSLTLSEPRSEKIASGLFG